ncbi:MAG: hypothetical protein IKG80_04695 [Clostridia bacterium]|nr:hypothetical protein [Clostridia bacterium]
MKKKTLDARVAATKNDTSEAILAVVNLLNKGQRQKLIKNEKFVALCERYGVDIPEA